MNFAKDYQKNHAQTVCLLLANNSNIFLAKEMLLSFCYPWGEPLGSPYWEHTLARKENYSQTS